jgi:polyhydroxyalkanoate synthase
MSTDTTRERSVFAHTYWFLRHAWERRAHKERFIKAGKTHYESVLTDELMEVRFYPPQDEASFELDDDQVDVRTERHPIPVLLVPPLGVYGWVYDLMAERSWVRFLNARGFRVYLVDWGAPQKEHAEELSVETYVNRWMVKAVEAVLAHSGAPQVSLVGYCMGGLLSLMYTGAHDKTSRVRNIVTIASPIDVHASGMIGKVIKFAGKRTRRLRKIAAKYGPTDFHVPGQLVSTLFKLTDPLGNVTSYFDLVRNLSDREYVKTHLTTYEWFDNMVDYPGAMVQRMVFDFGLENQLASGSFALGEHQADLTAIKAGYLAFAGKTDQIVSIRAARKGMELLASDDKTFTVVPGGHAGVFAGGKARDHTWVITADWLAQRSG